MNQDPYTQNPSSVKHRIEARIHVNDVAASLQAVTWHGRNSNWKKMTAESM